VAVFGLLSPLALYRGPLNPYGVGIGVYSILATLHVLPPVALVAAVMAVVQVQNVCDPTNTQNVWVANFTGVAVERITRLVLPYQVGVATLAVASVVAFGRALLGVAPFVYRSAHPRRATASLRSWRARPRPNRRRAKSRTPSSVPGSRCARCASRSSIAFTSVPPHRMRASCACRSTRTTWV
jgi:hypothetical protein